MGESDVNIGPLFLGFTWMHDGQGYSSHTSAVIASWHRPKSITWRWVLTWHRPYRWRVLGWLSLRTQQSMPRLQP